MRWNEKTPTTPNKWTFFSQFNWSEKVWHWLCSSIGEQRMLLETAKFTFVADIRVNCSLITSWYTNYYQVKGINREEESNAIYSTFFPAQRAFVELVWMTKGNYWARQGSCLAAPCCSGLAKALHCGSRASTEIDAGYCSGVDMESNINRGPQTGSAQLQLQCAPEDLWQPRVIATSACYSRWRRQRRRLQ